MEGHAIVKKAPESGGKAKVLTELGPGDYFGERALLYHEPRAASVTAGAEGELTCLSVSKGAFEEVLGPLTDLIRADSEWRLNTFVVRQLRKNKAKLGDAGPSDLLERGTDFFLDLMLLSE